MSLHQNILNDLNPARLHLNDPKYNQENALFCAALSLLSYRNKLNIKNVVSELNGLYNANYKSIFIEEIRKDTQVLLFGNPNFIVIAFRGTAGFKDIITDLKFNPYQNASSDLAELKIPPCHGGFRSALIKLITLENFFKELNDFRLQLRSGKQIPIILTGHSLGGALSNIAIPAVVAKGYNFIFNYNFASPKTFSNTALKDLRLTFKKNVYDIVNYKDYVPRAGSTILRKLGRIGQFYWFNKQGDLIPKKEQYFMFTWRERLRFFKNFKKYHSLIEYYDLLKLSKNRTSKVEGRRFFK